MTETSEKAGILERHKATWEKKKILRVIYNDWYRQILKDLSPSKKKTIELGSGSGNFKDYKQDILATDIDMCPWLNVCFDAQEMPFKNESAGNMVLIDVLHHIANPLKFFTEAKRVLEPQGRIVLIEPFPSPFSLFIYRRFHPEPFLMDADYFKDIEPTQTPGNINNIEKNKISKHPWEANQAAAFLLFFKHPKRFLERYGTHFRILKQKRMSCILYPASGGFENKTMIPDFLIPVFRFLEFLLIPLRPLLAFRCYIVLERKTKDEKQKN